MTDNNNLPNSLKQTVDDPMVANNPSKNTCSILLRVGHKISVRATGKVSVISVAVVSAMTIVLLIAVNLPTS